MKLEYLTSKWTKGNSLKYLKCKNINTPNFKIVDKPGHLTSSISEVVVDGKVSVRSFRNIRDTTKTFQEPFFPNHEVSGEFIHSLKALIVRGNYSLIVASPIDPEGTDYKGNIRVAKGGWFIEMSQGTGTVRDLGAQGKDEIIEIGNLMQAEDCDIRLKYIVSTAVDLYWGEPIILEWSLYSHNVGIKNNKLIYWELRRG